MLKTDNNYFKYEMIGKFSSDEDWVHIVRTIDSYELIFVLSGTIYLFEEDKKYELHANECILLEPGKIHGGYRISNGFTSFYWFHFVTDYNMPFKTYAGNDFYDVKHLLKKLLHESKTPSYHTDALDATALMVFHELASITSLETGRSFINNVAEYIRINADKNISVSSVAKYFGYNSDYISKLFKKTFGMGMKEYIATNKLKYAEDLLLTTDLSIKEIAAKIAFPNENLFIKFFNYHEKISPSRFRNKYYNTHINKR